MPDWLTEFTSPKWWATVFIAGIIINMLSRRVDDRLVKYTKGAKHWWSDRAQWRAYEREQLVEELVLNATARSSLIASSLYWAFVGMACYMLGIAAMIGRDAVVSKYGSPFAMNVGLVVLAFACAISFIALTQILRAKELLREASAREYRDRMNAEIEPP